MVRAVNTPMTAEDYKSDTRQWKPAERRLLGRHDARLFRRGAALTVYMSQDRPDLSAPSCNLATAMQNPTERDWAKLKRVCRYLKAAPRCVLCYPWQYEDESPVKLQTDSDWAQEAVSRRSHSGGAVLTGGHLLHAQRPVRISQRGAGRCDGLEPRSGRRWLLEPRTAGTKSRSGSGRPVEPI